MWDCFFWSPKGAMLQKMIFKKGTILPGGGVEVVGSGGEVVGARRAPQCPPQELEGGARRAPNF